MLEAQSVDSLNRQIGALLESTFLHVKVDGEISRPTYHNSGHLYFTLKDENSAISCVMFKGNANKLKFAIEDGMRVIIDGSISVYAPRGSYQINCVHVELSGVGALAKAYEQLKNKLLLKGYFENKKQLPKYPESIVLVTSQTGAALQDMLQVANKRWKSVKISLIPTLVQGSTAALCIAKAIEKADKLNADIIVVGRGGGSIEDLWAFNEEIVADAVFNSKTPIVSAVGHEIDFTICDFVADLRAPTPSAAMEMILPDENELKQTVDFFSENFNDFIKKIFAKNKEKLEHVYELYRKNYYETKIEFKHEKLKFLAIQLNEKIKQIHEVNLYAIIEIKNSIQQNAINFLVKKENSLKNLENLYFVQKPAKQLKEGFAQIVKNGKNTTLENIQVNDEFELQSPTLKIKVKALNIVNI